MFTKLDLGKTVAKIKLGNYDEKSAIKLAEELAKELNLGYKGWLGVTSFFGEGKSLILWRNEDLISFTIKIYAYD